MIQNYVELQELEHQHREQHRQLFMFGLGCISTKFTTVPTTTQVPNLYCAFYESGSTRRIYINFFGTMRYVGLT